MKKQRSMLCVNGCGKPIAPPSKVICQDCLDDISAKLEAILAKMEDSPDA